jgi:hypothetical protein
MKILAPLALFNNVSMHLVQVLNRHLVLELLHLYGTARPDSYSVLISSAFSPFPE